MGLEVLWFSHFVPYPPQGGAHQRSFNLIREVSRSGRVHLICFNLRSESRDRLASHVRALRQYCETVEVWELPLKWKSPRWAAALAGSFFEKMPFSPRAFWSPALDERFRASVAMYPRACLHFDSPDLGLYDTALRGASVVINHHNCESAMLLRRSTVSRNPFARIFFRREATKFAALERNLGRKAGVHVCVSEDDARQLSAHCPEMHLHVVDNGTDTEFFQPQARDVEPHSIVFFASLDWYPNLSAIRWFLQSVWPRVAAECPEARLRLAGSNPPRWLTDWPQADSRVSVTANPEDIRPCIAAAEVAICPMLDGGGTKLKVLDAMAMARPMVSTHFGAAGLRVEDGANILLADTPEEFSAAVIRLLRDGALRSTLGCAAREAVVREYSWPIISQKLLRAYQCALSHRRICEIVDSSARLERDVPSRSCGETFEGVR